MYSFLRNTQAIYQIILLLSDKTHLSGRKNLGWHLLQESALLYSSELISEICVRIDCRWLVVCIFGVDLWVGWGCTTLGCVDVGVVMTINQPRRGCAAVSVAEMVVVLTQIFTELGGFAQYCVYLCHVL